LFSWQFNILPEIISAICVQLIKEALTPRGLLDYEVPALSRTTAGMREMDKPKQCVMQTVVSEYVRDAPEDAVITL
tara:strand:+ start:1078 stop:1305 length:228 start_codon:yes stop_codon:yes gene_type:complete